MSGVKGLILLFVLFGVLCLRPQPQDLGKWYTELL